MTSVVVVDDENDLVELLVQLMEVNKIDVIGVGYDGKQAVELCTRHKPDFLILDLTMPKFDGFYALEKLQGTTQTKIILLTGMIDQDSLKKLDAFSILAVHTKPIDFDIIKKYLIS